MVAVPVFGQMQIAVKDNRRTLPPEESVFPLSSFQSELLTETATTAPLLDPSPLAMGFSSNSHQGPECIPLFAESGLALWFNLGTVMEVTEADSEPRLSDTVRASICFLGPLPAAL